MKHSGSISEEKIAYNLCNSHCLRLVKIRFVYFTRSPLYFSVFIIFDLIKAGNFIVLYIYIYSLFLKIICPPLNFEICFGADSRYEAKIS